MDHITGSADLYQYRHHEPTNSVNFVCAHDGFTLYDLTAYNEKHNWANGEGSRDGNDDNVSWNCGVEGETDDPWINDLRKRQVKNFAVTHMLSMGVPMIVAGDEFMRSQFGNNNTYCHDNEINWFDWDNIDSNKSKEMIRFWSQLIQKRKRYIDHFKGKYFSGAYNKYGLSEIAWHGTKLNSPGWNDSQARCIALTLGDTAHDSDQALNIHVMFNMYWDALEFEIPQVEGLRWYRSIDTALPSPNDIATLENQIPINDNTYTLTGRSVVVLASRAIT
jgi:glycogen operon protein